MNPALFDTEGKIRRRKVAARGGRYNNADLVEDTERDETVAVYLEVIDQLELTIGEETHVSRHRVFLEGDVDIDADDAIEIAGETYEVIGTPARPHAPWQEADHTEAYLRLVE